MQSAILFYHVCPSVRLFVGPSVQCRYCAKRNAHIVIFLTAL